MLLLSQSLRNMDDWAVVSGPKQEFVYTLSKTLEEHDAEIFQAGKESVESSLVAVQRELRVAVNSLSASQADARNGWREFDAKNANNKWLIKEQTRCSDEMGKLRQELEKVKADLAELKGCRDDEYTAAQAFERALEAQELRVKQVKEDAVMASNRRAAVHAQLQLQLNATTAERDNLKRSVETLTAQLKTTKTDLERYKTLAAANHDACQFAKQEEERVSRLARDNFLKWKTAEAELEELRSAKAKTEAKAAINQPSTSRGTDVVYDEMEPHPWQDMPKYVARCYREDHPA